MIPELSGAGREAMALWALFADTIEELAARLLVDEQATLTAVSEAIVGTLEAAQEDDVIGISFAATVPRMEVWCCLTLTRQIFRALHCQ